MLLRRVLPGTRQNLAQPFPIYEMGSGGNGTRRSARVSRAEREVGGCVRGSVRIVLRAHVALDKNCYPQWILNRNPSIFPGRR
jgi:hypothetical protein